VSFDSIARKLISDEELEARLAELREAGRCLVFTNGCFDLLHLGHVDYLERARQEGDVLVVGLNTDASVFRLKGFPRPLQNQTARARVLAALEPVDGIILFDEDTPARLIEIIRPNILVKGADYTRETIIGREFVESYGGQVRTLPLVEGYSTTGIIQKIARAYSAADGTTEGSGSSAAAPPPTV
jgi:rfaE bifunctional protein nucleotidyltransferase chain/domain